MPEHASVTTRVSLLICRLSKKYLQHASFTLDLRAFQRRGAIAQLGERLHGMQEVAGSIPAGSTNFQKKFRKARRKQISKNRPAFSEETFR